MKYSSKLSRLALTVLVIVGANCFGANECSTKVIEHKIERKAAIALQDSVNDGHQPWRLDAEPVAGEELLKYESGSFANHDAFSVHPKAISSTDRTVTYRWVSGDKKRAYTLKLIRPPWLLNRSKKYEWTVWFPVRTTIETCPRARGLALGGPADD